MRGHILWSYNATKIKHTAFNMTFKSQVTTICDGMNNITVTLVAALAYDAQAQRENISGSEQHAGKEQKLVFHMFPNNALTL
jgi:hypothetical protein